MAHCVVFTTTIKRNSLTSFCAPCYSEILFSSYTTGKWNGMERNKSGMEISPSDPSFDIHGGFQKRFKINRFQNRFCARVKKK